MFESFPSALLVAHFAKLCVLMWLRPVRLWARKCIYFTSFWQCCDTAPALCSCLWCGLDLSSVLPCSSGLCRGRLKQLWFAPLWLGSKVQLLRGEVKNLQRLQAGVVGVSVLRDTKQHGYLETGGLCSKCQFSSSCWSIAAPLVSETRCCILCVFCLTAWKSLHRTANKLRTLTMGE